MTTLYELISRLPLSVLHALGRLIAVLAERVFGYRTKVVDSNLARAFPEMPVTQRRQLMHRFYRYFAQTSLEIIAGARLPRAAFEQRVTFHNTALVEELSRNGQGSVIIMTIHQGNWEWMLHKAGFEFGMNCMVVYKRLHSASAERFTFRSRSRFGSKPVDMRDAPRDVIRNRKTPRLIMMAADQAPGETTRAHWTLFLNQVTGFFLGSAVLAKTTGFPVVFARCTRRAAGRYDVHFEEICRDPKALSEQEITERYVRLAEAAIKADPASWLWSNRRWKRPPSQAVLDQLASSGCSDAATTGSQSNPPA